VASPARPKAVPVPAAPEHPRFKPHPDDEAEIRAAAEDVAAGRLIRLSPAELERWEKTGEWPEPST
jgi:hypothetical protein